MIPDRAASRMRFARVMLQVQLACMALGAAALVYLLGFGVHPHQVGYACLIAACYVVITGIVTFLMQHAWRARAGRTAGTAARRADGAVTTGSAGVLGVHAVRAAMRSRRRTWLSVALLGVAMLIAFLVLVDRYEGGAMALESSGDRVQGVVTSVTGPGVQGPRGQGSLDSGSIDVRYGYAGQPYEKHIYLDDNSPTYWAGEQVVVTLDPADPQVATVGGSDNESPALVVLLAVLLLAGLVAFFLGLWMLIQMQLARWRTRRAIVKLTTVGRQ